MHSQGDTRRNAVGVIEPFWRCSWRLECAPGNLRLQRRAEDDCGGAVTTETKLRPMKSAPRDGTIILIRFEHENYNFCSGEHNQKEWEQICEAYWTDFNGGGWIWNGI